MAALLAALGAVLVGYAVATAYAARSLWRERRGQAVHAHADGIVHSHHRGDRRHSHPTFSERYDARLTLWFGPGPARASADCANFAQGDPQGAPSDRG